MLRISARILTIISMVMLLSIGVFLAVAHPDLQMGTLVKDDAGYYMAISRNHALGYGYTFDRLEPTNGFNPLVPILLIAINPVINPSVDLITYFRAGTLVSWLFVVLGFWSLRQLTRRVLQSFSFPTNWRELAVAAVSFFYAGFMGLKAFYGMDAFVVLGLGLLWLAIVSKRGILPRGLAPAFVDGTLLAAIVLARVDSLPLAAAAFSLMLLRAAKGEGRYKDVAARIAIFIVTLLPYLLWNKLEFGDWLPISAKLKTAFPHINPAASINVVLNTSVNLADLVFVFATLLMAGYWCVRVFASEERKRSVTAPDPARDAMSVAALYLTLRLAWLLFFSRFDVQSSYFILAPPFFVIASLALIGRWRSGAGALAGCLGLIALTGVLVGGKLVTNVPSMVAVQQGKADNGWKLGRQIHDVVGEREIIFGGSEGLLGFVADRAWINGDGVANNREFQDAINEGRLAEYLNCRHVKYVAVEAAPRPLPEGPFQLGVDSQLYGTSNSITLRGDDVVLTGEMLQRGQQFWLVRWPSPRESPVMNSCN